MLSVWPRISILIPDGESKFALLAIRCLSVVSGLKIHILAREKLTPVRFVAEDIVRAIEGGKTTVYAPKKWQLIMFVFRNMPQVIFHRLNI